MKLHDLVVALRLRWWVPLIALALGTAAGWLTAPEPSTAPIRHRAVHTLLVRPDLGGGLRNPNTIAVRLTTGDLRARATELVASAADNAPTSVEVHGDPGLSILTVETESLDPESAARVADVHAQVLVEAVTAEEEASRQAAIDSANAALELLGGRLRDVDSTIAAGGDDPQVLLQQREVLRGQYEEARGALDLLLGTPPPLPLLESLGPARSEPMIPPAPRSSSESAVLLGLPSLVLGVGLCVGLHRLDDRVATAEDAAIALGVPVLAEIPHVRGRRTRSHAIATMDAPRSPTAEAYRVLRTSLLRAGVERDAGDGHILLVTSTQPAEGKTTTIANLAAGFAETARTVLVIGGDVRKPEIHRYLQAPREPGLTDVLRSYGALSLASVAIPTVVPGVWFVPPGEAHSNPGELFQRSPAMLAQARDIADVVLIDAPPILTVPDAAEMLPAVDGVVLVSRVRCTRIPAAERAQDLLRRLGAPVLGTVLIGVRREADADEYRSADPADADAERQPVS